MRIFKGKAIYNPSGKAGEYAEWACNFYVGCSNGCIYCYCKKGILAGVMGQDTPQLKKCFKGEGHALEVFKKELSQNLYELKKHGLFLSFTTDPLLPETIALTMNAAGIANYNNVSVKILTKCAGWVDSFIEWVNHSNNDNAQRNWREMTAFGFTLTGHDDLEQNASPNAERIEAMRKLYEAGFRTFASIEPIIDIDSSLDIIEQSLEFCELFKVGLLSGKKYDKNELQSLIGTVCSYTHHSGSKVYFKDSLLKQAGINRADLPSSCVGDDYNMFANN